MSTKKTEMMTQLLDKALPQMKVDIYLKLQTAAILTSAMAFILFLGICLRDVSPLFKQWVEQVSRIADNTAAPTASVQLGSPEKIYIIMVPQKEGVSDEEWVDSLEKKVLAFVPKNKEQK